MEDSQEKKSADLIERLKKGIFPPAAVAGAFVSFAAAAKGSVLKVSDKRKADSVSGQVGSSEPRPALSLPLKYVQCGALEMRFQRSLLCLAIGPRDLIYALGDGEVRVFEKSGKYIRSWRAPESASCLTVGPDERICIGATDRVYLVDKSGSPVGSFHVGAPGHSANITAVKFAGREVLVADAAARCILRFDERGKQLGEIGNQNKTRGFILPNKSLDIDVDAQGVILATDSGRHRVTTWKLDGEPVRQFGKFGLSHPQDFVGCCNPVNIAFAPEGRIVTAEKVAARVKVFDSEGRLLGLIGPEHFDPKCTKFHLAVDSQGRILIADPVRMEVKIFSIAAGTGGRENV